MLTSQISGGVGRFRPPATLQQAAFRLSHFLIGCNQCALVFCCLAYSLLGFHHRRGEERANPEALMNALLLMAVYVVSVVIFESAAIGVGFITDVMVPTWSMMIFLGTTGAALWGSWPLALWLTRNVAA